MSEGPYNTSTPQRETILTDSGRGKCLLFVLALPPSLFNITQTHTCLEVEEGCWNTFESFCSTCLCMWASIQYVHIHLIQDEILNAFAIFLRYEVVDLFQIVLECCDTVGGLRALHTLEITMIKAGGAWQFGWSQVLFMKCMSTESAESAYPVNYLSDHKHQELFRKGNVLVF